jgi:hypothetical protein
MIFALRIAGRPPGEFALPVSQLLVQVVLLLWMERVPRLALLESRPDV